MANFFTKWAEDMKIEDLNSLKSKIKDLEIEINDISEKREKAYSKFSKLKKKETNLKSKLADIKLIVDNFSEDKITEMLKAKK